MSHSLGSRFLQLQKYETYRLLWLNTEPADLDDVQGQPMFPQNSTPLTQTYAYVSLFSPVLLP